MLARKPPSRLKLLLGALLFGWGLVQAATYTAPQLLIDWQIRDAAKPEPGLRLSNVHCTDWNMVFHLCGVTLGVPSAAGEVSREVNYAFVGPPMGRFTVRALADPAHPGWATTDLGLAHLVNRTVCLVLFVLAFMPMVAFCLLRATGLAPAPVGGSSWR